MYLDAESSCSAPMDDVAQTGADDRLKQQLRAIVQTAYPDFAGSRFRLEQGGGDHVLLIADEKRAFRFPRSGTHGSTLERAVLRALGPRAQVAVPAYDIVDPANRFASYVLIPGVPLTAARFLCLSQEAAKGAISTAVALLASLHALDPGVFRPSDDWPRVWTPSQFADRLENERLPLLAASVPTLAGPIASFLKHYRNDRDAREVILHGDLVSDHLLVDEQTGRLTGIIDFGDVALGDPARDFLGFWTYGACAAAHAVAAYGPAGADPTLLARSRHHFIRYRIDRLFEMIVDGASAGDVRTHSTALATLLAEPSTFASKS